MRFDNYILNEGRSEKIDVNTAVHFINDRAKYFIPKIPQFFNKVHSTFMHPEWIYRGIIFGLENDYNIVRPSQHERKSANTKNYYTWIMDNSTHWNGYPKRSKSIICSSTEKGAFGMQSSHFLVIPAAGSKVGICPDEDIWSSFTNGLGEYDQGSSMADFNDMLDDILGEKSSINTYKDFVQACIGIDDILSNSDDIREFLEKLGFSNGQFDTFLSDYYYSDKSFYTFIEDLMDPITNKFKLSKIEQYKPPYDESEVWTDGDSLLLRSCNLTAVFKEF